MLKTALSITALLLCVLSAPITTTLAREAVGAIDADFTIAPDLYDHVNVSDFSVSSPGDDISDVITKITNLLIGLVSSAALLVLIYAGILIVTAGGNSESVNKGKKTAKLALIGLIIALVSYGLVNLFQNLITTIFS